MFCSRPADKVRNIQHIGGTKRLNLHAIAALNPQIIIANKEENVRDQIEWLAERFPVWISDVNNLDEALTMIGQVGLITGSSERAIHFKQAIGEAFDVLPAVNPAPRAAYFIWNNPMMVAAANTFIDSMLGKAGFVNVFSHVDRYPVVEAAQLNGQKPDMIMLSSEPYPFREKHIQSFQAMCPTARVMIVDGQAFSWYGSRLMHSPKYFSQLLQNF
jgi:ABC-type Fe3+-hydroxamate transport system substrate-binding protein